MSSPAETGRAEKNSEAAENGADEKSIASKTALAAAESLMSLRSPPKQQKPEATDKVVRPPANTSLKSPPKNNSTVGTKQKSVRNTPKQGKSRAPVTNKVVRPPAKQSLKSPPKNSGAVSKKRKGSKKKTGNDDSNRPENGPTKSKKARTENSVDDDETENDDEGGYSRGTDAFPTKEQVLKLAIEASEHNCMSMLHATPFVNPQTTMRALESKKKRHGARKEIKFSSPEEAINHIHRLFRRTIQTFHFGPSETDKNMEQLVALATKKRDPYVFARLLRRGMCEICHDSLGMYFAAGMDLDTYIYPMCPHCYKYLDIGPETWNTRKAEQTFRIKGFRKELEESDEVPTHFPGYKNRAHLIRCSDLTDALYKHFGGVCAMHLALVQRDVQKPMRQRNWQVEFPRFHYGRADMHNGRNGRVPRGNDPCVIS